MFIVYLKNQRKCRKKMALKNRKDIDENRSLQINSQIKEFYF